MEFDLGIDFQAAETAVEEQRRPADEGDYTLQVVEVTAGEGKQSGRPKFNWQFQIINDPRFNGKRVFYNTSLPWDNPKTQQRETGGINFLVDVCRALGRPWSGSKIDPQPYIGLTCKAHVTVRIPDGSDRPVNEIARFLS